METPAQTDIPIAPPAPQPEPQKESSSHSQTVKTVVIETIFITVCFLIIFGALNYFNILPLSKTFPQQLSWLPNQQITKKTPAQLTSSLKSFDELPVSTTNSAIKSVAVNYIFQGTVTGVKNNAKNTELLTNIKGSNIPKFILDEKTKIVSTSNKKDTPAAVKDLKTGVKIDINSSYNPKRKAWTVNKVSIIIEKASTPSSSLTPAPTVSK